MYTANVPTTITSLPPLTVPMLQAEGRTREPAVEAQIRQLLSVPRSEFWRRAQISERESAEWIQEESLVSLLRAYHRQGEENSAWKIAEILIKRSEYFIGKQLNVWKSLSGEDRSDCARDVIQQLLEDVFNESRSCEFWEVRYWLCLKRRMLNKVQKYRRIAEQELSSTIESFDGERIEESNTQFADTTSLTPHQLVEIREALSLLKESERMAFVLFYYQDWSQQEIANRLNVTDRTVRNMLKRAEDSLQNWRAELKQ